MELYLLGCHRARLPESGVTEEHPRGLSEQDDHKVRRLARALADLVLSFDLVLTGPVPCAQQTARIVAAALGASRRLRYHDRLAGDIGLDDVRAALGVQPSAEHVLLVGDASELRRLLRLLTGEQVAFGADSLACVSLPVYGSRGRLVSLVQADRLGEPGAALA